MTEADNNTDTTDLTTSGAGVSCFSGAVVDTTESDLRNLAEWSAREIDELFPEIGQLAKAEQRIAELELQNGALLEKKHAMAFAISTLLDLRGLSGDPSQEKYDRRHGAGWNLGFEHVLKTWVYPVLDQFEDDAREASQIWESVYGEVINAEQEIRKLRPRIAELEGQVAEKTDRTERLETFAQEVYLYLGAPYCDGEQILRLRKMAAKYTPKAE